MSGRRRRRIRAGTSVHGGAGNATTGTAAPGDTEATGLEPDHPYNYVNGSTSGENKTIGDTVNRSPNV